MVVLYAKEALDIDNIRRIFADANGSFPEHIAIAVGPNYIPANRAKYEVAEFRFTAISPNPKAVFGFLLAIEHRK